MSFVQQIAKLRPGETAARAELVPDGAPWSEVKRIRTRLHSIVSGTAAQVSKLRGEPMRGRWLQTVGDYRSQSGALVVVATITRREV